MDSKKPELTEQELQHEARNLAANRLLPLIFSNRRQTIIERWQLATTTDAREREWLALKELDTLAGAIDDGIRKHGGTDRD